MPRLALTSNPLPQPTRRQWLGQLGLLATTAALWGLQPLAHAQSPTQSAPAELRIGYQKGSLALVVLKDSGKLAQRLKGTNIRWVEFNAGPPLLEALAVGSIDIGATGDAPPVFAQAAGKDLVYVAYEAPAPEGSAILVPSDSNIRTLAELKGKRVAFTKGSSAHFLIAQGLRKGGLTLADIQQVYLSPSDARAAFEGGNVDAWAIWDPYYAAIELTGKARVLATSKGLSSGNSFFLASSKLVQQYPSAVSAIVDELDKAARLKPQEVTQLITQTLGLEPAVVERYVQRRPGSPIRPLTADVIAEQQGVADVFYQAKVIPKPLRVADAVWLGAAKK